MKHDTMGYEILDHAGDIGIRVWADDLKGLFQEAARALFDIITDRKKGVARLKREVAVQGSGKEELMVAWLNELLYLHEVEELLFCDFALSEIEQGSLKGVARGERYRRVIPREGGMRTDGMVYADDRMMDDIKKDQSLQQVKNVAFLPGIVGCSLAMPDIHWGYGFPIGGVAAFDEAEGVVSPGGVGYDIN